MMVSLLLLFAVPEPGNEGYGTPVLGLHLYTWALLIFGATIFILAVLFFIPKQATVFRRTQE